MINRRDFTFGGVAALGYSAFTQANAQSTAPEATSSYKIRSKNPNFLKRQRGKFNKAALSSKELREHNYAIVEDFTGSAPTKYIERFELREGDCFGKSDCRTQRERSEVMIGNSAEYGKEYWYQTYFFVPEGFHVRNCYNNVVFNFHTNYKNGKWRNTALITPIMGGRESVTRHYAMIYNGKKRKRVKLKSYNSMVGRWNKIELNSKWHENGFHRMYYDGQLVMDYQGYTLGSDAQTPFMWHYGLYRGSIQDKKKKWNLDTFPTQWAAYSGARVSQKREGWL